LRPILLRLIHRKIEERVAFCSAWLVDGVAADAAGSAPWRLQCGNSAVGSPTLT